MSRHEPLLDAIITKDMSARELDGYLVAIDIVGVNARRCGGGGFSEEGLLAYGTGVLQELRVYHDVLIYLNAEIRGSLTGVMVLGTHYGDNGVRKSVPDGQ